MISRLKKNPETEFAVLLFAASLLVILFLYTNPVNDRGREEPSGIDKCMEKQDSFQKQFCIASAAEMHEDPEMCSKIGDNYTNIRSFCEARINLNKTRCRELNDEKLVDSCLESIEMKENWTENR